ncbi:endoplasmic reticulum metallopeptidase 1-like [Anticarsia gemmatalis]|uniref:endoplasmic reticulum metallopeptidase 1-like n=1 Tax=Anticarsia gemmatalis TaxID=129554 RepID=UPI003F76A3C1
MTSIYTDKDGSRNPGRLARPHIHEYVGVPSDYDDGRGEKPWQRVVHTMGRKGKHLYEPVKSVPSTLLVLLFGWYLLLGYLTQLTEDGMPSVVTQASLPVDNSDTFSEEIALRYLQRIVGDKPRVSGTVYHLQKTQEMKELVDELASQGTLPVRTDWQMVTGDFHLGVSAPFFSFYQNCSNVIAVLEGESGFHSNGTIGSSILVNCHYDSVPFALGASDNAVFCAVMAESLSKLSKRKSKLRHNVIFLFNGAEENGLQAAHGFLQHEWAKGVVSVINLDSAGMNGKPTIFQVTDPRVLNAYSRTASRPTAQALAEFMFRTGIIPSDTDFRIFRDFGDIHGIDIAFTKWGHVYHTRNDEPSLILPGVIQNAGDMLLALIAEVAQDEDMDHKISPTAALYYDYLGAFMLTYSFTASYVVDVFIALCGLASVWYVVWLLGPRWSTIKELLFSVLGRVLCLLAGIVACAICTLLMVATTVQMRYLSQAWLVVPLYWTPYLIASVAASQAFDAWRMKKSGLSRSLRTLQALAATRLILSVLVLILACVPAASTMRYLLTVPLFLLAAAALVSVTVVRYVCLTGGQHLLLEVALSTPAVMFLFSLALRLDAMMLPIMGRSTTNNPDYTVAILNVGLVALVATAVSGIELLFSRRRLWIALGAVGIASFVLMFIPFSPYDNSLAVQRHYWFHSQISSYDIEGRQLSQTSGVLVTRVDPYSVPRVTAALAGAGHGVTKYSGLADDCANMVYCGMPIYRTSWASQYHNAMFLLTGPPAPFSPAPALTLSSKICDASTATCTFDFIMTGGAHNLVTLWPYSNITVASWSLDSPVRVSFTQLDRPVYVIYHSTPTYMEEWNKRITVVLNVPASLQSSPIMEVSHHSHKLNHPEDFTAEYQTLVDAMPHYFNIATVLSFRSNYIY